MASYSHNAVPSDEETVRFIEDDEQEQLEYMKGIFMDLSDEMQTMIKITLSSAYKTDKMRGCLKSQQKE